MSEHLQNLLKDPQANFAPTDDSASIAQQLEAAHQAGNMAEAVRLTNILMNGNTAGRSEPYEAKQDTDTSIEQQLEAAVQAGNTTEATRLTHILLGGNSSGSSGQHETKQDTEPSKESILNPNSLYEIDTSQPQTLEIAGTKVPIVAAIDVERADKHSASYLVADISSLAQGNSSKINIGDKVLRLDREIDLGIRQRAKYVVLNAEHFSDENQDNSHRRTSSFSGWGEGFELLYPDAKKAAGVYMNSRRLSGRNPGGIVLLGNRPTYDEVQLMTIQTDSEGKLFIQTTAGDPACKISVHSEQLRESPSKPTFRSAQESPGFGFSDDGYGQAQEHIKAQHEYIKAMREARQKFMDDFLNSFLNTDGDPDQKVPAEGRGTDWDEEARGITQEDWKLFAEYPEERDEVVDMILDGRKNGLSDKEIYRQGSMTLHQERQNGSDPEVIDKKEKILRTIYDKNEGKFKDRINKSA